MGEGRTRLGRESGFAHARHHNRTRLNHHTPKTTDTHGRLDGLADRPLLPPRPFVGIPATRLNQHAARHIQIHIHSPPPCGSAPDFPTVPSLPVSPNLAPRATSVSPIVFGDLEAVLPAPPVFPDLLSWDTMRKSTVPNSEFLGGETGRGRPRWEGADHPEEPPPPPSPGGLHCACVSPATRAHTLSTSPPPSGYVRLCPARAGALPDGGGFCKRLKKNYWAECCTFPQKRCRICVDCISLITVPILTDREIYRHNSNYLKFCKTSGPPVILALPEATFFAERLEKAFRGLFACARL